MGTGSAMTKLLFTLPLVSTALLTSLDADDPIFSRNKIVDVKDIQPLSATKLQ